MAVLTVKKSSEMVGLTQNTLYRHIREGKLSKSNTGKGIDTTELIRVYGEIDKSIPSKTEINTDTNTVNKELEQLKLRVEELTDRVIKTEQREGRLIGLLESKLLTHEETTTVLKTAKKNILSRFFG